MDTNDSALARTLVAAWQDRRPVPASAWAASLPGPNAIDAIQLAVLDALDGGGSDAAARHWKSGGPRRDPALLGHAPLPRAGVRQQHGSAPVDCRDLWLPACGIEAEIALRLGRDVSPAQAAALDQAAAHTLIDGMAIAVELTSSRWLEAGDAPEPLRQADLLSHGALLLGPWLKAAPCDWANQACWVEIQGQPRLERQGSHSLGDPFWLLPHWLRHATRHGQAVKAGTVVTTGSWTGTLPLAAGQIARVGFEGLGDLALQR